jgi:TM2 domain-containing membrane protein YozV
MEIVASTNANEAIANAEKLMYLRQQLVALDELAQWRGFAARELASLAQYATEEEARLRQLRIALGNAMSAEERQLRQAEIDHINALLNHVNLASGQLRMKMQQVDPVPAPPATVQQPPPVYVVQRSLKSRGTALLLEILPGLFGFYGIGWIYAGKVGTGLAYLLGMLLIWVPISVLLLSVTAGISLCFTLPVNVLILIISAATLSSYARNHPDIFGA